MECVFKVLTDVKCDITGLLHSLVTLMLDLIYCSLMIYEYLESKF